MKKLILTLAFLISFTSANALDIKARAYILKDLNTGKVLASKQENKYLPPASTTKLMTLYILFEQIKNGKINALDKIKVSKSAWRKGGSKMFLEPNSKVSIVDLIKGIAVSSGNDASTLVAEYIAGDEKSFVEMMNKKAKEFGMRKTNFVNPTGWDDRGHVSTARDLSILAERIIKDFPEYYPVFKLKAFKYNNIRQLNKNTLLGKLGVDGLKTGHVNSIGYNIVSSAKQGNKRYLIVLLGAKSKAARESEVKKLYKYAYKQYKSIKVLDQNETIARTQVYLGKTKITNLGVDKDVYLNLTKDEFDSLEIKVEYTDLTNAPIYKGQELGKVYISYKGNRNAKVLNLVAKYDNESLPFNKKIIEMIKYKFNKSNYFEN